MPGASFAMLMAQFLASENDDAVDDQFVEG